MARQAYAAFADRRMKSPSKIQIILQFAICILQFLNAAAAFLIQHVQPAFLLGAARPPPRSFVLSVSYGARARPTTDTRIAPIVERIVRNVVLHNEGPHFAFRPAQ